MTWLPATAPGVSPLDRVSAAERAAIDFAEQYVLDPHELTDAQFERLRECFDAPATATLVLGGVMVDALVRVRPALGIEAAADPAAGPGAADPVPLSLP